MSEQVSSPNFDDERTLRSARKVVPLNAIDAKVRRRRRWFLGGAFAVAMMLGAAAALIPSYLRMRNAPPVVTDEMSAAPVSTGPVAVVENPVPSESPDETEPPAETALETPKKELVVKPRSTPRHVQEPEARDLQSGTEDEDLHRIRDAVLLDEWQERRERRVFRRQRRLDRYNHRDLSNLDEIFEGRKRP